MSLQNIPTWLQTRDVGNLSHALVPGQGGLVAFGASHQCRHGNRIGSSTFDIQCHDDYLPTPPRIRLDCIVALTYLTKFELHYVQIRPIISYTVFEAFPMHWSEVDMVK